MQQSSMAGGDDSVMSVEAFNFLEVSVFGLHTFFWIRHFSSSVVPVVPVAVCQLDDPRVVPLPTGSSRSAL